MTGWVILTQKWFTTCRCIALVRGYFETIELCSISFEIPMVELGLVLTKFQFVDFWLFLQVAPVLYLC